MVYKDSTTLHLSNNTLMMATFRTMCIVLLPRSQQHKTSAVLITFPMLLQEVHSLDLVAAAPGVIACNMAHTPLDDSSCDAAVFSLALMGTDYGEFLLDAARVLKKGGWLWIAEVSKL